MLNFFRRWMQKRFTVALPDINTYASDQNFRVANTADILAAIDRYCASCHHQVTYLSADPIVFQLDGGDTYQATLVCGRGRYLNGYYVQCQQVTNENIFIS